MEKQINSLTIWSENISEYKERHLVKVYISSELI